MRLPFPTPALLLCLAASAGAAPIRPEVLLSKPAFRALLPAGVVQGTAITTAVPVLARAEGLRTGEGTGRILRVAMVLLEKPAAPPAAGELLPKRQVRLIVARQVGSAMQVELTRTSSAYGVHSLQLANSRPGGLPAVAIHWAERADNHQGRAEIWPLGENAVAPALATLAEGCYLDGTRAVVYAPERGSLVVLPAAHEWQGLKLVPSPAGTEALASRLLAEYDEVLQAYAAEKTGEEPPRMVVDVALSRARMLERMGRHDEAIAAYEAVPAMLKGTTYRPGSLADHQDNLLRSAEAVRRAAALR